jgi:hypothetical protein
MKNGKKYHTVGTFKNLIREGTYFNEFIASYWRKAYVSSWVTSNLYVVGKGVYIILCYIIEIKNLIPIVKTCHENGFVSPVSIKWGGFFFRLDVLLLRNKRSTNFYCKMAYASGWFLFSTQIVEVFFLPFWYLCTVITYV